MFRMVWGAGFPTVPLTRLVFPDDACKIPGFVSVVLPNVQVKYVGPITACVKRLVYYPALRLSRCAILDV